jgi:hypothetical protein
LLLNIQIINLKLEITKKQLLKTKIYLENLNLFFNKFRDIVIKIIKITILYLNLKLSILSNFVYKSSKNINKNL